MKQWANVPSEKTTDDGLNAAIANKNDSQKDARKAEESRKAQAQEKLISELTKGYTNANSSSSSAVAVGGNTTNNTGARPNENKIRDRVSPELAWAAFAATR